MRFRKRAAGVIFLFGLGFLDTRQELNADFEILSYNQEIFGPRNGGTEHVDVELPQAFAERKKLSLIALEDLLTI